MAHEVDGSFSITIEFVKDSEKPSRVFESMSSLIKALQDFDRDLAQTIDSKIEPVLIFEDIQIGSLKAWLGYILRGVPDEAIKDLSWKKAVGAYLLKAKNIAVEKLDQQKVITDAAIIEDI